MGDDHGYGAVLALAMLLGGVLLVGLASDVARLVAAWQEVSHVAHTGAEVGAGWVDPGALYDEELVVDEDGAIAAVLRYLDGVGVDADVEADRDRVCVTAHRSVEPGLIRLIGATAHRVEVRACAEPRQG